MSAREHETAATCAPWVTAERDDDGCVTDTRLTTPVRPSGRGWRLIAAVPMRVAEGPTVVVWYWERVKGPGT